MILDHIGVAPALIYMINHAAGLQERIPVYIKQTLTYVGAVPFTHTYVGAYFSLSALNTGQHTHVYTYVPS